MRREDFEMSWDMIVEDNIFEICAIDDIATNAIDEIEITNSFENVFKLLKRLKNNKFYNDKEIETIYLIAREDILNINDILNKIYDISVKIEFYEIIETTFNDLIGLSDSISHYECSGNLLKFMNFWFQMNKKRLFNEEK